eukprot:NODE_1627_length_789_cov_198.030211_g1578_i0.p1 GENE.NODE_1627_length_789_cov_198.030211_g1578_i0~~NODE_1627_length_789_cov_198.030211_g1578_i0.p1  ORF type:complete len:206 (-),score=21.89 NODE_1627_length_789_cov_198.030211_g1578_i0:73-690(-)
MRTLLFVLLACVLASAVEFNANGKPPSTMIDDHVDDRQHNCSGTIPGSYAPVHNGNSISNTFNCSMYGSGWGSPWSKGEWLITKFNIPRTFSLRGLGWFTGSVNGYNCSFNIGLYDAQQNLLVSGWKNVTTNGAQIFATNRTLNRGTYYINVIPYTKNCAGPECGGTDCTSTWYWKDTGFTMLPYVMNVTSLRHSENSPGAFIQA